MAVVEARAGVEAGLHRNVVHVLDAAGDLNVLALGGDALGGLVDGLEAGAAVAVDRHAADLQRQPGDQRGHAGHVVALFALLLDAAPVDVFDLRSGNADALHQGLHQVGRQVVGADVAVDALFGVGAADGRADGVDDNGAAHGEILGEIERMTYCHCIVQGEAGYRRRDKPGRSLHGSGRLCGRRPGVA